VARARAARAPPQRTPRLRGRARRRLTILGFMSPWIVGFSVFILYPMLASLYFSFTRYDLLSTPEPVGLQNYVFMFTKDPLFWQAIRNTLWMIVFAVPVQIVFAIFTAWMLTKPRKGIKAYRTIFFLPSLAPPVAAALAFVYILHPSFGFVNQFLQAIGVSDPPLWFNSTTWSKPGLLLLGLWGVGSTMIIFLAGLLDVPAQLYEAADIEGASGWQKFRFVTLPSISPVIFFSLVIGVIQGFQYFTQAYVASLAAAGMNTMDVQTGALGYPKDSTLFYSLHLYREGFVNFSMGYASALAWVLFVVTMVCTLVLIRSSRRWVHYAGGGFR
jgi:multiple sugar transport system permease protein